MKILCVHQSSELYGSDRSFLLCVEIIRRRYPDAVIDVVLPKAGPLSTLLEGHVDSVRYEAFAKLQKRDLKYGLLNKITLASRNLIRLRMVFKSYDLVYINTVVILDYLIASRFFARRKIVHVREIPTGLGRHFFSEIVKFSRASVIFNSDATSKVFKLGVKQCGNVVPNGVGGYALIEHKPIGREILKCLVIGRLSQWKGQGLVVDAIARLPADLRSRVNVRIVGGVAAGNESYERDLVDKISVNGLSSLIEVMPFSEYPQSHFEWADVVIIPSVKPEPFGLVAIEGMSAGRLIVAADHGGLSEIVRDRENGLLFKPGMAEDLAKKLIWIDMNRDGISQMAMQAKRDFVDNYSVSAFERRFLKIIDEYICEENSSGRVKSSAQ